MRNRAMWTVVAAAVVAGGLAVPAPATAAGATAVTLPVAAAADIVTVRNRVFVSGGPDSAAVAVTNGDGRVLGTVPLGAGTADLALSGSGHDLYVALPSARAIAVIDTRTLTEIARYPTGDACPRSLARTARWLYFGYNCGSGNWDGNIGVMGLDGQGVRYGLARTTFYDTPRLEAPATTRGPLLAWDSSLSPATISVYGVGRDGTPTWLRDSAWDAVGSNLADVAVTGDGTSALTAAGAPYEVREFTVADLAEPSVRYGTGPYPIAVELDPGEARVAAAAAWFDPDVQVFGRDGAVRHVATVPGNLFDRALAWSPDGTRLYAVTGDPFAQPPLPATLHVLPVPA